METIKCESCNGTGTKPMPERYAVVLKYLRRMRKVTSADVHQLDPASTVTLANKRLEYLRRNGYATRTLEQNTRTKPFWIYTATTPLAKKKGEI